MTIADAPAVLVMAYGTPRDLDDVERYYTDIRSGRTPAPEALDDLRSRYRAIGGRSPLAEITAAQALGIAERLGTRCFVGYKHSAPSIADAVTDMTKTGVRRAVGLVMAPHFSAMSVGDYERRARAAAESAGWEGELSMISSWHLDPGFISFLAKAVDESLASLSDDIRAQTAVIFTAHSLPESILRKNDPYPQQLRETAEAVARETGLSDWRVAWQSAGRTEVPWLGPDLVDVLGQLARDERRGVVVCPCGFVADHLEVLYDVDIEARQRAHELGLEFARTRSPNDDPDFLDALVRVVEGAQRA